MRILLVGTHSVGKTTLMKRMSELGYNTRREVIRKCMEDNAKVKINKEADDESQTLFFNETMKSMEGDNFIADRCPLDILAYTSYQSKYGKVSYETFKQQYEDVKEFVANNNDLKFVFIPIEFPLENDGVRDTDEEYRKDIENEFINLLLSLKINYSIVTGTVEERIEKIISIYDEGVRSN